MSLDLQVRNGLKAAALWLPLPPASKTGIFYDLYGEFLAVLSGDSGFRNIGLAAGGSSLAEAQAELCRETVRGLARPGRWLDIGCGEGGAACTLAVENPSVEICGLDLHDESVERARQLAGRHRVADRVHFRSGDACRMPFAGDGLFDGAYAVETACHYHDKRGFAAEVARVLEPGGRFACADFVLSGEDRMRPERAVIQWIQQSLGLPRMYTAEQWRGNLENAGFRELRVSDITAGTFACLPLWSERMDETRAELERRYPAPLVLSIYLNIRWLIEGLDAGQLRYALIEAELQPDPAGDSSPAGSQ